MHIKVFASDELTFASILSELSYENPFSPRRRRLERELLGKETSRDGAELDPWQLGPRGNNKELEMLKDRALVLLTRARARLAEELKRKGEPNWCSTQLELYADLVRFVLYYEFEPDLKRIALIAPQGLRDQQVESFVRFKKALAHWVPSRKLQEQLFGSVSHLFALAFQLCRAFQSLYRSVLGASRATTELRASVWNSIFSANRRRYDRALYDRMHETSTLIIGASGTGKELVARAIGASRYIGFDEKKETFVDEIARSFLPLNLAELSVHLIESELFGHKKGAFSGAVSDREGFLELCPQHGTLFLDEIGELSVDLQVKLLRTLQARRFHRVGETKERSFRGKLVSATNRDLNRAMREGSMREDFYYRICSDVVWTPSLRTQLSDRPEDLQLLVQNIAGRLLPEPEVDSFVEEALASLQQTTEQDYPWPGNVRELEQCVRSILIRGEYEVRTDFSRTTQGRFSHTLEEQLLASKLSSDELSELYVGVIQSKTDNFSETARLVGLDRRTVKAKYESYLLRIS